jgi:3-hydroxyisobutyrate dehydrogenase-like beta-hydroxyacid dehydrogenase
MSGNAIKAGFQVAGYDIDGRRNDELARNGGTPLGSPREVAQRCDLIVACLPGPAALRAVIDGPAGLAAAGRSGVAVSECSTLALEDKLAAQGALAKVGIVMLDSPLSGTGAQAARKDLIVFCSGDRAAYDRFEPIYQGFARGSHHLGPFGNGTKMKLVANLLVAIHNLAAAEGMVLARKAGLDPAQAQQVLSQGAGMSRMLEVRGPSMVAGEYPPMMKLELWMKDVSLIGQFAAALRCPTPLFSTSAQFYAAAMAQGHHEEDPASICAVLEGMAGVARK